MLCLAIKDCTRICSDIQCKEKKLFLLQDFWNFLYHSEIMYTALNVLESNLIMSIRWPRLGYLLMRLDKSELKRTPLVMEWVKSWAWCQTLRDSFALMAYRDLYLSLLPSLSARTGRRVAGGKQNTAFSRGCYLLRNENLLIVSSFSAEKILLALF